MKVKLCGFTDASAVEAAIAQKCDFIGFIFCDKSPRFVTFKKAAELAEQIPATISKVAVVVNVDLNFLRKLTAVFTPDFFQFHGDESCDFLLEVRKNFPQIKIIKAFKIEQPSDLQSVNTFKKCADFFLFDGKIAGSGQKFDWHILRDFHSEKEWFLSGGLNHKNIAEAVKITGSQMIDISSGIEEIRGQKSLELIKQFMTKAREL